MRTLIIKKKKKTDFSFHSIITNDENDNNI